MALPLTDLFYGDMPDAPAAEVVKLLIRGDTSYARAHSLQELVPAEMLAEAQRFLGEYESDHFRPVFRNRKYVDSDIKDGAYDAVMGRDGWYVTRTLFDAEEPDTAENLNMLHDMVRSNDPVRALGAVVLACAYRTKVCRARGRV